MLIEKVHTEYRVCRIPGLILTDCGSLLGYYECRDSTSDWAQIDLKVIRSTDRGDHFETVTVIPGEGHTLNNPMMVVDGSTIHFLYLRDYRELFYCQSTDDGKSFTPVRNLTHVLTDAGFYNAAAVGPGHGIVAHGTILLPIWIAANRENPRAHHPSHLRILYSKDGGDHWALGDVIGEDQKDPNESALAQLANGSILISIRNEDPRHARLLAISENGYDHWQHLHFAETLPDPICMGSMTHRNGVVYHVNCESKTARENLTVKVSRDGFQTFTRIPVDVAAGYADIAVDDHDLFVFYERDIHHDGLYFQRIPLPPHCV